MTDNLLPHLLSGFNDDLLNQLRLGKSTTEHPVLKGDTSELAWLDMLQTYLPKRYEAQKGIVIDSEGSKSEQIDIVIFDRQYSPFIFTNSGIHYIPAESVYAVFEVKQSLNKDNLAYAQQKTKSVRSLKKTSLPVPNIYGTSTAKEPHFIHGGLLSLSSDWTPPFGQPFEKQMQAADETSMLNLVCAASEGFFELDEGKQIYLKQKPVTMFFFRLVSVLQQKGTAPMMDIMAYAKWLEV